MASIASTWPGGARDLVLSSSLGLSGGQLMWCSCRKYPKLLIFSSLFFLLVQIFVVSISSVTSHGRKPVCLDLWSSVSTVKTSQWIITCIFIPVLDKSDLKRHLIRLTNELRCTLTQKDQVEDLVMICTSSPWQVCLCRVLTDPHSLPLLCLCTPVCTCICTVN